jgi:hypothetical protein
MDFIISPEHPQDGRDWDCQCARCGSSMADCQDCLSPAQWCTANPMPGREAVERGAVEWYAPRRAAAPDPSP